MAHPVRSKQLYAGLSGGPGVTSYYTAQAGETTLVKSVQIYGTTGAPGVLELQLETSPGLVLKLARRSLATNEATQLDVWWVLHPGDSLRGSTSAASTYHVLISGAELKGVAD